MHVVPTQNQRPQYFKSLKARKIYFDFVTVDDVNYLEGDLVTLAGWGSYYNERNQLIDKNPTLKLINLRVNI